MSANDRHHEEVRVWLGEAEQDSDRAHFLFAGKDYSGCAFHCQQVAEKALKALLRAGGLNSWGHELDNLLERASALIGEPVSEGLLAAAKSLEEHYTGARYPGVASPLAPSEFYTESMAHEALQWAEEILTFVRTSIRTHFPDTGME